MALRKLAESSEIVLNAIDNGAASEYHLRVATTRNAVREFLGRTGRTQRGWAEELGITAAHLSMILTGQRTPSLPLALQMAESSGLPVRIFCQESRSSDDRTQGAA